MGAPSSEETQIVAATTTGWLAAPRTPCEGACSSKRSGPAVWALDGKPIAQSSHMLLTHLTDVQNTGIEYADPDRTILLKWGGLPHLMHNGAAEIELTLACAGTGPGAQNSDESVVLPAPSGNITVFRLSTGGRRLGEVPFNLAVSGEAQNTLHFTVRTDLDPAAATFLYEIVRE